MFDDSIRLAIENISSGDSTGVFYQGLGLSLLSKFLYLTENYESTDLISFEAQNIDLLKNAEVAFIESIHLHKLYLNSKSKTISHEIKKLIIKNIASLYNSLSNIFLKYYSLHIYHDHFTNDELLIEVRRIVKIEIDDCFKSMDMDFELVPTFNHTEAVLEYFEALHFYKAKKLDSLINSFTKIMHATNRVSKFQHKNSSMNKNSFEIITQINKLRVSILKDLGYI